MKIDRTKVKKSTSEVSEECKKVIQFLKQCGDDELLKELEQINVWFFGKCELYHWIDVLDRFDEILATVAKPLEQKQWIFQFDVLVDVLGQDKGSYKQSLIFHILKFTALLIEHSYARHLYNSIEHLIVLLDCADGNIILAVLNLIYVFSKRSNYLSRLPSDKKKILQEKLVDLAQTWGGLEAGCALNQCCSEDVPAGAGNVYFEYYMNDNQIASSEKSKHGSSRFCIDLKNIHHISTSNVGEIMENIIKSRKIPEHIQMSFYHRLRLAHAMTSYKKRLQFVQARLQALSILVYSNSTTHINTLVYDGLIEEIVNTLKLTDNNYALSDVKASCLKTLTAIIHLDRNPRLQSIIDSTGAMSYHGFLPTLVRQCIQHMTDGELEPFPQQLATSLFSFLYHLASYEAGCESLVASGLIEPLLKVVLWPGQDDHITFVTRAVRVIDLITNLDMAAFQTNNGLSALVGRLENEVKFCSAFHGPALPSTPPVSEKEDDSTADDSPIEKPTLSLVVDNTETIETCKSVNPVNDIEMIDKSPSNFENSNKAQPVQCLPQRAALLKSILNFLKKAIPDPAFVDNTRSLMDENLQSSLKMIISNAEYYGALLFLLATDVVTVFIFHEPSLLSSLQDSGLTWVVLRALIVKDVPATRENLASLPNTLSALCLNTRGLQAFVKCKPFERLFGILMSPEYLPAMKRRRSSDPQGDTAMNLGSAMDELMRHQPTLKTDAMKAIIQLLQLLADMGSNLNIIAFHPTDKTKTNKASQKENDTTITTIVNAEDPLSDDEMEEEYRSLLIRKQDRKLVEESEEETKSSKSSCQRKYVPVVDYVLNVTKFLDNILSNNGTDDHCVEFVRLNGLKPLYSLLKMPNFPLEFPLMPACQSISQVCKSIAMLSQENKVFKEGLTQLNELTDELDALYNNTVTSGSVLLHELAASDMPLDALNDSTKTPIVHTMSAIHAYINVFVFLCRGAQTDVRNMSIQQWGSDIGQCVLKKLSTLYMKLVWESSTLLTLCTPNLASEEDLSFAADDLGKLTAKKVCKDDSNVEVGTGKKGMSQLTLLKWLLTSSSHLGRALAELFGLLVYQCVGSQNQRLRRHNPNMNQLSPPTPPARNIAALLTKLLMEGLSWKCPDDIKVPRLRLTFYICSVGFSTPMLFDNMKNPYHLMLQEFQKIGGIEALFKAFDVVLEEYIIGRPDEDIKRTVGIGEFLEGWLGLVNRLANTKFLFESTHMLPTSSYIPGYVPFDAAEFMTRIHKHAFSSIIKLWQQKVFKSSDNHLIAERILNIFCHIIKGESLLPEKFAQQTKRKEKNENKPTGGSNSGSGMYSEIYRTPAPTTFGVQQPEVNESHVQRFVDMGFSQQHAREALVHSRNNLEAATEYLLTTPAPILSADSSHTTAPISAPEGMDIDMSEEDMMIQAIAMSLVSNQEQSGEVMNESSSSATKQRNINNDKEMQPSSTGKTTDKLTLQDLQEFSNVIGECMKDIFYGSLDLLDAVPSTVHTVCDLLLAMAKRNGETWRNESLRELTEQIMKNAQYINDKIVSSNETEQSLMQFLCESKEARQLSARLHLFLLMSQGLGNSWLTILKNNNPFNLLILLLKGVSNVLTKVKQIGIEVTTPELLAPLLLIFDQFEKTVLFAKRMRNREKSHTWKWFDDRSGRWCNYSASNNSSIDTAYQGGESTVRFTAGRRRYMVLFKTLVQINEDTGNRRPIMLDVMHSKKKATVTEAGAGDSISGGSQSSNFEVEEHQTSCEKQTTGKSSKRKLEKEKQKADTSASDDLEVEIIEGLNNAQIETVIEFCVEFIRIQVNPSTLNAVIRLLLRFTREYEMALIFARRNGVQYLLQLTESSSFPGALPLASLLLRHIVEDINTMKHAVDRAVALAASNGVPNIFCGVGQNSVGAKELHYLLRALGPIACRNTELYNESAMKIMRITTNSWRGQVDKNVPSNTPQIVKVPTELKSIGLSGNVQYNSIMEDFVHVLLCTVVERYAEEKSQGSSDKTKGSAMKSDHTKNDDKLKRSHENTRTLSSRTPQLVLVRRLTGEHIDEDEMTIQTTQNSRTEEQQMRDGSSNLNSQREKPLASLSVILRLLAELSKSYAAIARLIVDYKIDLTAFGSTARQYIMDGPILAFIFDYLLPHNNSEIKESKANTVSMLARQLLSVLGSYWHNVDIQNVFVTELKNSLSRTLNLPESKSKHHQLQALFNLITSMIETAAPISFSSHPPLQNTSFIKLLIKRGLISDLARIAHHLDLSSHDLVPTINVMLKPLEKLSNLANSQNLHQNTKQEKDAKQNRSSGTETVTQVGDAVSTGNHHSSTTENSYEEQQATARNDMQNLEDIVEVMVPEGDEESGIFGETLIASQSANGNGVERRIYITPNPMVAGSSESSSDSSDREDRLSNHGSQFDDLGNVYSLNDDATDTQTTDEVVVDSANVDGGEQRDVVTSSQNENNVINTFDIIATRQNTEPFEDTIIIERGDEDDATSPRAGIDEEDDDDDDEEDDDDDDDDDDDETDDEGNDEEDDDEGSDMDADDTIAADNDAIIFDEGGDATDDVSDPFADLDDHGGALEFSFPQRPFTVHIPQIATENVESQIRPSYLSHPLLLRTTDQAPRSSIDRSTRGRGSRGERGFGRQHGNAIHINGNSGSFARILIGDEIPSGTRVGGLNVGEDIFLDMFGDANQSSTGLLNQVPSALSLWTVESRLLDGASVHECVNELKPNIIQHLESIQVLELQEKITEEKRSKENTKKNESTKVELTSNSATTFDSSTTTAVVTTTTSVPTLESTTASGTLVSSVLTSQEFPIVSLSQPISESMEASPVTVGLSVNVDDIRAISNSSSFQNNFETLVSTTEESCRRTNTSEIASMITPHNPMPEVLPNAPQRNELPFPVISTIPELLVSNSSEIITTTQSMSSILSVSSSAPSTAETTPRDLPRMNQYRSASTAVLTGGLGFSPQMPANLVSGTPRSELPSVAEILATPADIPSLQQIRSSSLFSHTATPTPQSIRPSSHDNILRDMVPSPLLIDTNMRSPLCSTATETTTVVATSTIASGIPVTSGLAADLAAAIMSQLVTSSPTPSVTTTAQSIDAAHSPLVTESNDATHSATATIPHPSVTSSSSNNSNLQSTDLTGLEQSNSASVLQVAEQIQQELEGLGIPEGVDPSFLAALPENIREEVLRDQFGIRLRSTNQQTASRSAVGSAETEDPVEPPQEVSPEFLAALPEEVQQEVLEQQRLEQARFTAAQQRPEQPVDPGEFVRNLNPSLRRQVLADMDDSVLAVLPPELTNEAQGLRRELQQRRMQIQAERALTRSDFSQLLRHRGPGSGFQSIARLFPGRQINTWKVTDGHPGSIGSKKLGRQLLDPESLTCLLVLLFLNDSTLNASRLHRILRNLSYHHSTKHWIILALISILRRTSSFHQETTAFSTLSKQQYEANTSNSMLLAETKSKSPKQQEPGLCVELPASSESGTSSIQQNHWLSRTLNLAFGGCVNIFQLQRVGRKPTDYFVTVHQQACLDVCKQILEALSFLAKNFPSSFSPSVENYNSTETENLDPPGPSNLRNKEYGSDNDSQSEFWDILVRLNSSTTGLKGKATQKTLKDFPKLSETTSFVTSPLGQILSMLSHPVVKQSTMLTDKLLRLLAVISMSLPERPKHLQTQCLNRQHDRTPQDNSVIPPDNAILPSEIQHPIHTVTFADTDDVLTSHEPMLPAQRIDDYEPDTTSAEAATVCSETASVASSLYVEPPEIADGRILTDVRSPRQGSIVSAFSDGTIVQSDISGAIGEQNIHPEQDADTMAMDVDTVSHPTSDTSSGDNRSSPGLSMEHMSPEKEPSILIGQLRMAVNVLTTGTCSDEGLEDATTLLLQLSRTEPLTRDSILELLLEGAQDTANFLRNQIKDLLIELKEMTVKTGKLSEKIKGHKQQPVSVIVNPSSSRIQPWRGRGGRSTSQTRRVRGLLGQQIPRRNIPKPVIYDLHLPTMATLTAKRSSQSLLLRILKVILQLRDAAKKIAKKPQTSRSSTASATSRPRARGFRLLERLHHGGNSLREVVAALEADMEAMYEMIDRFGGNVSQGVNSRNTNQSGEQSNNPEASDTEHGGSNREENSQETAEGLSASSEPTASEEEKKEEQPEIPKFPCLSSQLQLDELWDVLGEALAELTETTDTNAVLVLQPAVEAFFLVHGSEKEEEQKSDKQQLNGAQSSSLDVPQSPSPYSPGSSLSPSTSRHGSQSSCYANLPQDTQKFLRFAETHRTVLNQILRQSSSHLSDGPFAVLVNHTRLLDFDIKRRYFRQELEKEDKGHRREDMAVHIRRDHVFEDSYRELHRRSAEDIKNRLYIVFDGEEGQDAGGLLREWYSIMAREMFNPNYALFTTSQGEKATYLPNRNSHLHENHLSYFKFAGRIVAKAIYDNKLLDCYFTRSFYKHILGKPVTYTDMESEDYSFYQGLVYLLENHISDLGYELTFSLEVQRFGANEVHDLKPNGHNILVTEDSKREYVKLVCIEKMTGSIRKQIDNFLEGFYEVIPKRLISIFDEQELELLIAGLPTIDIEDLKLNTEYHKYTENSLQIQWFWRALRSFDQADRAKFLQFVTGTSKVPLQGFSMLEGMNGVQKFQIHRDDRSTDRLPCAHTCFNQLDLPPYETYDKLFSQLLKAVQECTEGFGLA